MECDGLGFHLSVLDLDLVAGEDHRNVLANTSQVTVPIGHILVGDARGHVKHNDGALPLDVVPIAKATEHLLTSCIPHVEFNSSTVGVEGEGVDLDSKSGDIFFLKLSRTVTFHERRLSNTAITDEDELEFWNLLCLRKKKKKTVSACGVSLSIHGSPSKGWCGEGHNHLFPLIILHNSPKIVA